MTDTKLNLSQLLKRYDETSALFALGVLILAFAFLTDDFMSLRTWGSITTFGSILGIVAIGSTLLMIAGEFDLSVGSTAALSGMVFAIGITEWQVNSYLMTLIALSIGIGVGFLNGWLTLTTGIPSFITTLGTMLAWRGVVLAVSNGFPISLVEDREGVLLWFGSQIGQGFYTAVLWWIGIAIGLSLILNLSAFGNHVFAAGGDPSAARGMGVNVRRIKLWSFVICSFLAALSGIILFSELQDLSPTAGENYELYGIACAVIGGTSLKGGKGTIIGTVFGTLLIGVVQSGLVHVGIDSYWFRTFVGILLILAVILNLKFKGPLESKAV